MKRITKTTKTTAKQGKGAKTAAATKGPAKATTKPKTERKPAAGDQPKRRSALDAAAEVLRKAGKPMRSQELITAMAEQGLWSSPNGKTPAATLYAAILREVGDKAKDARFRKVERGLFEYAGGGR
ncbi:MAG: winged helix-turn-helix domain-containing protein [Phycisphaerae bacterium]|nr:winged helix-turn-helix domain-containing protein [Phycisphaerae bacterium]